MKDCTHIIIDNNGLVRYNQLTRNGYKVLDFIYEFKPSSFLHLEYMLGKFIKESPQQYCFHLSLRLFQEELNQQKNYPSFLRGIDMYYHLQKMIHENRSIQQVSFVFYSFLSLEQIKHLYPVIIPDLEQNNFRQLPYCIDKQDKFLEYQHIPMEAVNLLRGSYLSGHNLDTILSDKTVLIIDDDFETMEKAYQQLFKCRIIGLKQEKKNYSDLTSTAESIIRLVEKENIDLIISDLYLSETHVEYESNILNAKDISGVKLHKEFLALNKQLKEIPLIFLTSSTRVWNYLQLNDISNFKAWVPKSLVKNIHSDTVLLKAYFENLYFSVINALNTK